MIALLQFALVCGTSIYRFRNGVLLTVFFLAFAPRSLSLAFGGSGSLSFARMAVIIILGGALAASMARKASSGSTRNIPMNPIEVTLIALVAYKFFVTALNSGSLLYALDDGLFSLGIFAVIYRITDGNFLVSLTRTILLSAALTAGIVAIEWVLQVPLHYAFANKALFDEEDLVGHFRDERYRAQGIFDNSLSLAEFAIYATPTALFALSRAASRRQRFRITVLLFALFGVVLSTGSRGGLLVMPFTVFVFVVALYWQRLNGYLRSLSIIFAFCLVPFIAFQAFGLISQYADDAKNIGFVALDAADRSSASRALQYYEVFQSLLSRPFTGFGMMANFARSLDDIHRIDNYYLRVGLEGGFVAMALFIVLLITMYRQIARITLRWKDPDAYRLRAYGFSLLAGFAAMKLFLSMPTNNIYLYVIMASIVAIGRKANTEDS